MVNSVELLNNVKVYSTFNNEVLGEFNLSDDAVNQIKTLRKENRATQIDEIWNSGYKLNTNPTIP